MTLTDENPDPFDCLMVAHTILTSMIDDKTRQGLTSWNEEIVRIQIRAAIERLGYSWNPSP